MLLYTILNYYLGKIIDIGIIIDSWETDGRSHINRMKLKIPKDFKYFDKLDDIVYDIEKTFRSLTDDNFVVEYEIMK